MTLLSIVLWLLFIVLAAIAAFVGYFVFSTQKIARYAERAVPARGKFVDIDGNRIHYIETGEGLPILLVHGLGGHLHHMRPILEHFGGGYRLIAIDRAGSGYSTRGRKVSARLPDQARLISRFIEALGLERPLLVGHSLGGAIALATALEHPDQISGLALIAPLTDHYPSVPPEFAPLYIESPLKRLIVSHTVAVPASVRNAPKTLAFIFGPQEPPADYAVVGGALAGLRPSHIFATATDLVSLAADLPRQQERYGEIRLPVGILFGSADRVLDHTKHGLPMRDRIGGLDLEILEGIGHMPQYAALDRVIAFVRRMADKAFAEKAFADTA